MNRGPEKHVLLHPFHLFHLADLPPGFLRNGQANPEAQHGRDPPQICNFKGRLALDTKNVISEAGAKIQSGTALVVKGMQIYGTLREGHSNLSWPLSKGKPAAETLQYFQLVTHILAELSRLLYFQLIQPRADRVSGRIPVRVEATEVFPHWKHA